MQAPTYRTSTAMQAVVWSTSYVSSQPQGNDAVLALSTVDVRVDVPRLDVARFAPARRAALSLVGDWCGDDVAVECAPAPLAPELSVEDRLVNRWRAGDRAAGDELVRLCTPVLRAFFRRRTNDNVDELMQRTLVACIRAIDRFEGRSSFKSFLLGIAHKQLMMSVRSSRQRYLPLQVEAEDDDNPSQLLSNKEDVRSVAMALRETSPQFRRVLELFYWEDLSVEEIAKLLDLPTGTVKSRLARGRSMIKARLIEEAQAAPGSVRVRGVQDPAPVSPLRDRSTTSVSSQPNQENENNDSAAIHPSSVSGRRIRGSLRTVHGVGGGRIGAGEKRARVHGQLQECAGAGAIGATG